MADGMHPMAGWKLLAHTEDGKHGHHALKGPDAHRLAFWHRQPGTVEVEGIPDHHRQIAASAHTFDRHFDPGHPYLNPSCRVRSAYHTRRRRGWPPSDANH